MRVITYYGVDNQIDGIILDVLLRKHKKIRSSLGISVPVPVETDQVINALLEGVLLRGKPDEPPEQMVFDFFDEQKQELHDQWENVAALEKRSRTMFTQESIKVYEVARELKEMRESIGSSIDVAEFTRDAVTAYEGLIKEKSEGIFEIDLNECPQALQDTIGLNSFSACFHLPVTEKALYLIRTHPVVENMASYVLNTAFDKLAKSKARRVGVLRSGEINIATTLLLLRLRYQIITRRESKEHRALAEDWLITSFTGSPKRGQWLTGQETRALLDIQPEKNVTQEEARHYLRRVIDNFDHIRGSLDDLAKQRGDELLESHRRVRKTSQSKGQYKIQPQLPPDVLGIYSYLPVVS